MEKEAIENGGEEGGEAGYSRDRGGGRGPESGGHRGRGRGETAERRAREVERLKYKSCLGMNKPCEVILSQNKPNIMYAVCEIKDK